jgi:hypothetical protein
MAGRSIILNIGNILRFWNNIWLDNSTLMDKYPELFDVCQEVYITFQFCSHKNFVLQFRRRLFHVLLEQW